MLPPYLTMVRDYLRQQAPDSLSSDQQNILNDLLLIDQNEEIAGILGQVGAPQIFVPPTGKCWVCGCSLKKTPPANQ
jgi:hypothetical protein